MSTHERLLTTLREHRWSAINFCCACGWAPRLGTSSIPQREHHLADVLEQSLL